MNYVNALKELADDNGSLIEWGEPIGFDDYKLPEFNTAIFPEWLGNFVEGVAESTQTPKDASGIAAISILSTILARKYEVKIVDGWIETLNTYTVMALGSANRKSSVLKSFIQPVMEYEREQTQLLKSEVAKQQQWFQAKQKRIEKLEKDYARSNDPQIMDEIFSVREEIETAPIVTLPSFITADSTPEKLADLMAKNNEKISILSAEGAEVFQMMAGRYAKSSNLDIYLKGHSADNVSIDRIGREPIKLHDPTLTIGLFVQPSVVKEIPSTFQDRGLTQRFLYSFPVSKVGYREIEPKGMLETDKTNFDIHINKLLQLGGNTPVHLTLDKEAKSYEVHMRTEIEKMLREDELPEGFKGWIGKLAGQIIRVAGLLHVAEHVGGAIPPDLRIDTLKRADALRGYFIQHAKKAHGVMGVSESDADARYLLKKIKEQNRQVVDYRTIQVLTNKRFKKSDEFKHTLQNLERRGFIQLAKKGKKTIIHVHPDL
ncbi:YfjI family protein [Alteribacter keqinensis]|uniref:DUF3987 domain-containing protein n=1 Tax=Alteribacter keqinensis TaxID=2483800 RepID=A0A3M7TKX6_9BACI|nr:YfjI family protein [Alteribacter keqinensis]RNA66208.1 DUF3987 domain-containing protein [Alteribacter keqinensis]